MFLRAIKRTIRVQSISEVCVYVRMFDQCVATLLGADIRDVKESVDIS